VVASRREIREKERDEKEEGLHQGKPQAARQKGFLGKETGGIRPSCRSCIRKRGDILWGDLRERPMQAKYSGEGESAEPEFLVKKN